MSHNPEHEVLSVLSLFISYLDGNLLEVELVSGLSRLPRRTLSLLPDGPTKAEALRLKAAGNGTLELFGGITVTEINKRAANGSPAAEAMRVTTLRFEDA